MDQERLLRPEKCWKGFGDGSALGRTYSNSALDRDPLSLGLVLQPARRIVWRLVTQRL